MGYPPGFTYVSGEYHLQAMPVHSTFTFAKRNPLSVDGAGTVSQYSAGAGNICGISTSDSSQSYAIAGTNYVDVLVPEGDTIFANKGATGIATSAYTAYGAYNLALNTEHLRVDTTSTVSKIVEVVPRGDGTSDADSTDSSVFVRILPNWLKPFSSGGTVIVP